MTTLEHPEIRGSSRFDPAPARPARSGFGTRAWRVARGWLLAGLVLAVAIAGARVYALRPHPVEVRVATVERGPVEQTVSSTKAGSVRSRQSAELSVDAAGAIVAIHAREGATVRRGAPLVSIDRRDAEVALESAIADVAAAGAQVQEAQVRRADAEREHRRLESLRASRAVSEADLDRARTAFEAAVAAENAARARGEAAAAAVRRAGVALEKCDLLAPFDGVVAALHVEVGEWAVSGKAALRFVDLERVYVRAEIDEVDLASVRDGLPVRVTLDPYKGRKLPGRLLRVAPVVSEVAEQNRTLEVEVELDRVPPLEGVALKPGTSADVEVIVHRIDDTVRVPALALIEGARVLVAGGDGRAHERTVRIGLRNWDQAEVLEGLALGERVIISLESGEVKDGALLRVAVPTGGR